jgi:acetylornithine deacetylase
VVADVPALDPTGNAQAAALIQTIAGVEAGDPVAFATDGAGLQVDGLPSVVCGPGSIEQAHRPDEFIEVDQLERCDAMIGRIADWARGRAAPTGFEPVSPP